MGAVRRWLLAAWLLLLACCGAHVGAVRLPLSALLEPQSQFPIPTSSRPFRCVNAGFYSTSLPASFVLDGVCDCCDGSDERVQRGQHPFFTHTQGADGDAVVGATGGAHKDAEADGWGWGMFSAGGEADAAVDANPSPCPNTCATQATAFLAKLEARIDDYAAGVAAKQARLASLPSVVHRLQAHLGGAQRRLDDAVTEYKAARAMDQQRRSEQSQERIWLAERNGNRRQAEVEHWRWMLGHPVPSMRDRQVQRPPGQFGPQREWLLLLDVCLDYAWPQRRFGAFGEHRDWYLMQLCPLANATQSEMKTPPAQEGSRWREGTPMPPVPEVPTPSDEDAHAAAAASETVDTPDAAPQSWSLGRWAGDLLSQHAWEEQRRREREAAEAGLDAPDAETDDAKGNKKKTKKKKKKKRQEKEDAASTPSAAADPPGSTLSPSEEPRFAFSLRGGEPCWQVGPRQADVVVRCGRADEITAVEEDGKCRYRFELASPLACDASFLQKMRQQLVDYRSWFARPAPQLKPAPTREQMLHDEL